MPDDVPGDDEPRQGAFIVTHTSPRRPVTAVAAIAAAAGLALAAVPMPAAAQSDGQAQPQATAPATDVSEQEVQQIARISNELMQVNESVRQKMASAGTDAEPIRDNGLSVERYNAIVAAARNDEALMRRIRETMQTM
jgi:hypothetical protein